MEEDSDAKQATYPIGETTSNEFSSPIKPLNTSQPQLFTEEKAMTQAFNQMVSNYPSQIPNTIDKNQLFESFLLFHNYLINNQSNLHNTQQNHPNQFTISKSSEKSCTDDRETIDVIKDKHEPINPSDSLILPTHKDEHLLENSARNSKMNALVETNDTNRHITPNKNNTTMITANNNSSSNNYDEIPIKTSNANFMELFEKSLANDTNSNIPNETESNPKKKIVKAPPIVNHPKKNIQVSKPTKNEKKYFYYTDLLDENGKLVEEKKLAKTLKAGHSPPRDNQRTKGEERYQKENEGDEGQLNIKNTKRLLSSAKNEEMTKKVRKSISNIQPVQQALHQNQYDQEHDDEGIDSNDDNDNRVFGTSKTENVFQSVDSTNQEADYLISLTDDKQNDLYEQTQTKQSQSPPKPNQYDKFIKQPKPKDTDTIDSKIEQRDSSDIPVSQKLYQDIKQQPEQSIIEKKQNSIHSKEQIIEKKIAELNSEILRFKEEKEKVETYKAQYEDLHYKLQNDVDELNKQKNSFEEWKDEETKKIQKEKKKISQEMKQLVSMKQSAQNLQLISKRDKEQIDTLKGQISKMQIDIKQKENTSKLMIEKLKKQIEDISMKRENTNASIIAPTNQTQGNLAVNNDRQRSSSKPKTQVLKSGKTEPKAKNKLNSTNSSNTVNSVNNHNPQQPTPVSINNMKNNKQQQQTGGSYQKHNPIIKQKQPKPKENPTETFDFVLPEKYHGKEYHLLNQETSSDGKIIRLYNNDKREVIFQSGVRKEIYKDGYQIVYFSNGDLKQVFPDSKSVYYFKDAKTVQTTFEDGLQVFKFNNGQIEKHYVDGTKKISFPDGSIRNIMQNGYEETYYSDGTIQRVDKDNVIVIEHPDGLKEIKYPDGREECVYPDGYGHDQEYDDENNNMNSN